MTLLPSRPRSGWVLDTSVAMKLLVEEEGSDQAARLLGARLAAPDLLLSECANVLWKMEVRGTIPAGGAAARAHRLLELGVELLPHDGLLVGAVGRALRHGHPAYDCFFLEVAAQKGFPLVTDDRRLARLSGDGVTVVLLSDLSPESGPA